MSYKDYFVDNLVDAVLISDESQKVTSWINDLQNEGYEVNQYAIDVLTIFGGLFIKGQRKNGTNTFFYELYFNPIDFAGGEYDRMSIYKHYADDVLFPIGGSGDYTFFVGKKGKYYYSDWSHLFEVGDTIDDFLQNMASEGSKEKEIYNFYLINLIEELEKNEELRVEVTEIKKLVHAGECKLAAEKLTENVLDGNIFLDEKQKNIIMYILEKYKDDHDNKLIEKLALQG